VLGKLVDAAQRGPQFEAALAAVDVRDGRRRHRRLAA